MTKAGAVLAQQERDFGRDRVADQQLVGVLGNSLGEHHDLIGSSNFPRVRTELELDRRYLLCQFQELRILGID